MLCIFSGEKPFECSICNRRFREQSDLRKHRKIHNSIHTVTKCMICHQNQTSSPNSKKCLSCERKEIFKKTIKLNSDAIVPRIDVNTKKSFLCKYCDRAFGSSSNLKRHIMIHTGEKPFTCSECKRPFREMSTLRKHLVTHRRQNSLQLNSKNATAILQTKLQKPATMIKDSIELKANSLNLQSLNKCPFCKTICKGTENLMSHIASVHRSNSKNNNNISTNISIRKYTKSPPPLIPINKAVFKYLNMTRI